MRIFGPLRGEKGSNHDASVMPPWERMRGTRSPVVARPSRSGRQQAEQAQPSCGRWVIVGSNHAQSVVQWVGLGIRLENIGPADGGEV
jgi:hypothetical protein